MLQCLVYCLIAVMILLPFLFDKFIVALVLTPAPFLFSLTAGMVTKVMQQYSSLMFFENFVSFTFVLLLPEIVVPFQLLTAGSCEFQLCPSFLLQFVQSTPKAFATVVVFIVIAVLEYMVLEDMMVPIILLLFLK